MDEGSGLQHTLCRCDEPGKRSNPERCSLHKLPGVMNIVGKPVFVPKKLVCSLVKFVLIAACIYEYTHTDRQTNDELQTKMAGGHACPPPQLLIRLMAQAL